MAEEIRKEFSSPIELVVATAEELETVDGIGSTTAESIVEQLSDYDMG